MGKTYFPKVKEAREALKDKALLIFDQYLQVISEARAAGDFETAADNLKWLMEHMPHEEGERVIDPSAAKPTQIEGPKGPSIQIGIALGGASQKALPAETQTILVSPILDVEPLKP